MRASKALFADYRSVRLGDVLEKVSIAVDVDPDAEYREIGIRSHGNGIFHKPSVKGVVIGEKRVFEVQPDCLVLNIVFAWEQAIARTTDSERGFIASHRFPMFRSKGDVDIDYLLWFFKTPRGKLELSLASPGGAGRNKTLNQSDFDDIYVSCPPLETQRYVSQLLEDWDDGLRKTEASIDAKRRRFRWVYSQLFPASGTSLPEGWQVAPITKVAAVRFSGVDKKTVEGETPVFLCNYTDVFNNRRITADLPFMAATAKQREIEAFSLRQGDVVFTKDSETAEDIGASAVVAEPLDNVVCAYHLGVARAKAKKITGDFLAYALRHPWVREEFRKAANGVTRFGLNLDVMDEVHVLVPPIEKQKMIAAALHAVEDEIDLLNKSLASLRQQKRGLMQRLFVNGVASTKEAAE
jgi:type I restriction enzyme S subunit